MSFAALLLAAPALAQFSPLSFSYQTSPTASVVIVQPDSTVFFPVTPAGTTTTVTFFAANRDSGPWQLSAVDLEGSGFLSTGTGGSVTIAPASSVFFSIHYSPTANGNSSGTLTLRMASPSGTAQAFKFTLAVQGTVPGGGTTGGGTTGGGAAANDIITSWINYNAGSQTPVGSGDTIPFPSTVSGSRVSLAFIVNNRGKDAVALTSVSLSGTAFEVSAVPLLPASISGGGEVRFNIVYSPPDGKEHTGQLRVTVGATQRTFTVRGVGQSANLDLEIAEGQGFTPVAPGTAIQFVRTTAGTGRSSIRVRLRNSGNLDARLGNVAISGTGFTMIDGPQPGTVSPGQSIVFSILFAPLQVGEFRGTLRVDNAQYPLTGQSSGYQFAASLVYGDVVIPLKSGSNAAIPNTDIGGVRNFSVEVTNVGDELGFISAVTIVGEGFGVSREARFPMPVPSGNSVRVPVYFAPLQSGTAQANVVVHDLSFTLVGVAIDPPPLPGAVFVGVPAKADSLQQPAAGLELVRPYPYDLAGRAILAFTSDSLIDDPAVQFLSGARSVDFRIPANTTRAIFGANLREIRFQTGSLAGTITLVAAITVGKFDLTRNSPPVATVEVGQGAPVIRNVLLSPRSSRAIDLVISGAAPYRTATRILLAFTAKPGTRLQSNSLSVDVASQFESWFQSTQSRPFGGQFTVVLTIELSADYGVIDTIGVRVTSPQGTSAAKTIPISSPE